MSFRTRGTCTFGGTVGRAEACVRDRQDSRDVASMSPKAADHGHETPADRLRIDSTDFLWIYVEAELPAQAVPKGEYCKYVGGMPDPATRTLLGPPTVAGGQYRFSVIHYTLSPQSKYLFRFADNLAAPTYEDHWDIVTV